MTYSGTAPTSYVGPASGRRRSRPGRALRPRVRSQRHLAEALPLPGRGRGNGARLGRRWRLCAEGEAAQTQHPHPLLRGQRVGASPHPAQGFRIERRTCVGVRAARPFDRAKAHRGEPYGRVQRPTHGLRVGARDTQRRLSGGRSDEREGEGERVPCCDAPEQRPRAEHEAQRDEQHPQRDHRDGAPALVRERIDGDIFVEDGRCGKGLTQRLNATA